MKMTIPKLLATFLLASSALIADADIDLEDLSSQNIKENPRGPFSVEISGDYTGRADFDHNDFKYFTFATGEINLNFVFRYEKCYKEGAALGVSYMRTRLDWKFNPFFTQKDIDSVSLNLAGFSEWLEDWIWKAQINVNFDNIEYWNLEDYMNYDLILWGRYACGDNLGIHLGFFALTGMKIDRLFPIIGIDWTYSCHWKVNLVFPMNISVIYTIDKCWSISLASRFITQRHRVKKDQFYSRGLWFYTSSGAELALKYSPREWFSVDIHAGENFGGHLKVADRHYQNSRRLKFGAATYAGAQVDINF